MAAFERQGREVLYGGLIIVLLLILAVGLFMVDAIVKSFDEKDRIYAVLPQAPNFAPGVRVWIGGKDIGEVTEVILMPFRGDSTSRIALTIEFPHEYHAQLRRDSYVRVTSARMIGEPVLDITPGSAGSPALQHGDTLYMGDLVTLVALQAKAAIIKAAFDTALTEIRALSGPVNRRMESLQPVMRNMTSAQVELTSLMEAARTGPAARMMSDGRLTGDIAALQETVSQLGPALAAARARMTGPEGGASVSASLQRMQGNAERLSAALASLQAMMVANNGTLYRMSADSALLKTLHTAKAQLDSLIAEAKANPTRFVF